MDGNSPLSRLSLSEFPSITSKALVFQGFFLAKIMKKCLDFCSNNMYTISIIKKERKLYD
ncbi:hypothetical protein MelnitzEXVC044M_66 [Methylophilales phage Melnitz EXVC044M]|nr:hypothetical protein Melnitz1EXVC043M_65 [Methylophilales phage Melnitz-1 EXVC043M]QZI94576.1 hypothetical protein Melnitz2EXVC040M_66 [Methylophilales phage Melnitz-2 EXVC040M]QZI94798.1 hypothetical protein MelnitzEXVC044M_66 [Methylophilales phage Melnitz EXVC044M]QZI95019.1 hypothetical protein Melnitz3EXVC039M_66 [Methylophilales phage Melnitz-3 EXVC039M]